jgi:hypothetical protein
MWILKIDFTGITRVRKEKDELWANLFALLLSSVTVSTKRIHHSSAGTVPATKTHFLHARGDTHCSPSPARPAQRRMKATARKKNNTAARVKAIYHLFDVSQKLFA